MSARRPPIRSSVWIVALVLTLATGATLGQTLAVVNEPIAGAGADVATESTARAFYAAANEVIRSGDSSALDGVLSPAFVDHAAPPWASSDRAGLANALIAVHALAPAAHLTVTQVFVAGDRAAAMVAVDGMEQASFVGVAIQGGISFWGDFDTFRISGGRIAERWSGAEAPFSLFSIAQVPFGVTTSASIVLKLERVDFEPGESTARSIGETRVLEVETGRVTATVDAASIVRPLVTRAGTAGPAPASAMDDTSVTLSPGDLIVLPEATTYTLADVGTTPATVLVAAIFSADDPQRGGLSIGAAQPRTTSLVEAAEAPGGPWSADLTVRTLLTGVADWTSMGDATVGAGRVVLAPGAWLSTLASPGPWSLIVETGTLEVGAGGGPVRVTQGATVASKGVTEAVLEEGDCAQIPVGTSVGLHNPGTLPASALIVAIVPNR